MITRVTLRRFKRFEEESFDLRGPVILAGPNNCGKSTVLQAVATWALVLRYWRTEQEQQRESQKATGGRKVTKAFGKYAWVEMPLVAFSSVPLGSFDMLWNDRNYKGLVQIEVEDDKGMVVAVQLNADSRQQIYVRPKEESKSSDVLNINCEVVYLSTVGGLSKRELKLAPESIETLLGEQRPGEVVRNILLQVADTADWPSITGAVSRLFNVVLHAPQTIGGAITCEFGKPGSDVRFDLLSAGSGMQQVVMLLGTLYWRRGSVILVDEPDAHLHVFLQDTIFSELRRAAAATQSQLVIATHSEVILDSAEPEQICLVLGTPKRLVDGTQVERLKQAMAVLSHSDVVISELAPGILYLEGYTDLNLLRVWAEKLDHPLRDYFGRTPFWKPIEFNVNDEGSSVKAAEHFKALQLVKPTFAGVWLIDSDGRGKVPPSTTPEPAKLNRLVWERYETESYLLHPATMARFIDAVAGSGGTEAVLRGFTALFEAYAGKDIAPAIAASFIAEPLKPTDLVAGYLKSVKARKDIIPKLLSEGGIHGMDYTSFSDIAAVMLQEEIHPEVKEKLDFIQQAFGL